MKKKIKKLGKSPNKIDQLSSEDALKFYDEILALFGYPQSLGRHDSRSIEKIFTVEPTDIIEKEGIKIKEEVPKIVTDIYNHAKKHFKIYDDSDCDIHIGVYFAKSEMKIKHNEKDVIFRVLYNLGVNENYTTESVYDSSYNYGQVQKLFCPKNSMLVLGPGAVNGCTIFTSSRLKDKVPESEILSDIYEKLTTRGSKRPKLVIRSSLYRRITIVLDFKVSKQFKTSLLEAYNDENSSSNKFLSQLKSITGNNPIKMKTIIQEILRPFYEKEMLGKLNSANRKKLKERKSKFS